MSEVRFKKLTRPEREAGAHEIKSYREEIAKALIELGVGYGQEFAVVRAESVDEQTKLADLDTTLGPFTKDSGTSRQAALDNYPRSGSQRWRILQQLALRGDHGAIRDELAAALSIPDSSADARAGELRDAGFIGETDRTRQTRHGSEAVVLVISEKGRREIREHGDE